MAALNITAQPEQGEWITPEEQLRRWNAPILGQLSKTLPPELLQILGQYIALPSTWYTALQRIGMLPARIPALPDNIYEILNKKCPIHGDKLDSDGDPLKIWQTHSLYLIPAGTLDELEERVRAYGQAHLAEYGGDNPLKFRFFWTRARQQYGKTLFNEPLWVLMSNDILPESRKQSYEKHAEMVEELSKKAFLNYEVPSLRAALGVTFLHKVATGESILQAGNEQNNYSYTYTRINETTDQQHLVVGACDHSGVNVVNFHHSYEYVGVSAFLRL